MSLKPIVKKLIKILTKMEFKLIRRYGKHVILKHSNKKAAFVPVYKMEWRECFSKIIKETGLTRGEF